MNIHDDNVLPALPSIIPEGTALAHAAREFARQALYESSEADKKRLDWLDKSCSPFVENQTVTWPYGEHTANEWGVIWPASTVREAIDKAMNAEKDISHA